MRISIITTFYNGNKYMTQYWENTLKAARKFLEKDKDNVCEIIIVNDSPNVEVENTKEIIHPNLKVRIVSNDMNVGIHASRIHGVQKSYFDYILFLDQDDIISEECLTSHSKTINGFDVSVSNGYFELSDREEKIYLNDNSHKYATKEWAHVLIRDFIVSPGQCLIKKSSIPVYWLENRLENNGTDDYLLWLLMFNEGRKFCINIESCYTHKFHEENLSRNESAMIDSHDELLLLLERCSDYSSSDVKLLKRRMDFKSKFKGSKLKSIGAMILNFDILLVNIFYRFMWKGYIVKDEEY